MARAGERGERAHKPSKIPPRGWKDVLKRTKEEAKSDNIPLVAAGVAFYALLSLFPLLIAAISLFGLVMDPAQVEQSMEQLLTAMPEQARSVVQTQMRNIAAQTGGGLGLGLALSIAVALWTASSGMTNLQKALSLAYDEQTRGFLKGRLTALALTLGGLVLLAAALAVIIGGPIVYSFLGLPTWALVLAQVAQWLVLAALFIVALGVLYHFGPNRDRAEWRWVSPGAVLATVLLLVISVGFSIYVAQFGSYNETYGALGGVIVLLLWLYFAAFAILIGAELNAEAEHQTRKDTTVGEDRPAGERGAFVADTRPGLTPNDGRSRPDSAAPPPM